MIVLRNLSESDFKDLKKFVSNSQVTKYLTWKPYFDDKKIREFLEKSIACVDFPNEYLAIIYKGKLIGTIHLIDRYQGCVQFGFGIMPDLWGQGLGNVAVCMTLDYIKKTKWSERVKEIWADTHKDNLIAKKILLKNNFINTGFIDDENIRERYKLIWTKI